MHGCQFACKNMKLFSCVTGSNFKSGRLREVCINGHTVVMDTHWRGNKTSGWMTLASSTRQLDNGEDRLEDKQDSCLDDISCTQYRNFI